MFLSGRIWLGVVFLGALVTSTSAQQSSPVKTGDFHITQDSARSVYTFSAFAHGHRHGYEEGFHFGNEDYHLLHSPDANKKVARVTGYRHEFGDKKSYMQGFASGYRAGYADSYSGQAFRSTQELTDLAAQVAPDAISQTPAVPRRSYLPKMTTYSFDAGVGRGYQDGFSSAESTAYAPGLGQLATAKCEAEHMAQPDFCGGYGAGFLLGKDDIRSIREFKGESARISQLKH
ncbi:MAG: hypothetical protein JWO13_1005 [Acidobacteriales bacterium]|nr:hypothetical protein [Terriglobales bacterium]